MNELLMIVGVFVFFISVYGAVMVGGHLLEELGQLDETPGSPAPDHHLVDDHAGHENVREVVATKSTKEY